MELKMFQATISDTLTSYALRCDASYLSYMKNDFVKQFPTDKFTKFRNVIKGVHNGENVGKEDYSLEPTDYIYLSVTGIKKSGILWDKTIWLKEEVGKKLESSRLIDQQLIVGRSGTYVGLTANFNQKEVGKKIVIPSGYTMIVDLDLEQVIPRFAVSYLNSSPVQEYFIICSTEKNQRNLSQRYLRETPFLKITNDKQKPLVDKLKELDEKRLALFEEINKIDSDENNLMWKKQ